MVISIHAAREGGDVTPCTCAIRACIISIHAAREGGDRKAAQKIPDINISIHAAREGGCAAVCVADYFNPRRP